jgi:hypothetical protein
MQVIVCYPKVIDHDQTATVIVRLVSPSKAIFFQNFNRSPFVANNFSGLSVSDDWDLYALHECDVVAAAAAAAAAAHLWPCARRHR